MKKLFVFLFALLCFVGYSQTPVLQQGQANYECGTDKIHQRKMQNDPVYRSEFLLMQQRIDAQIATMQQQGYRQAVIYVPVVVHVIHLGEAVGTGSNISDAQIKDAIRGLNERWNNTIGNGLDMTVQFCLAQKNPSGNATSGINRVNGSAVANYTANGIEADDGDGGAVQMTIKNLSRWSNTEYYNIWVVHDIVGSVAGYALYPTTNVADGTVIDDDYMNYSTRTLAHEIGHAFNLPHTFDGDNNGVSCPTNTNCSTQGDLICDTPPHKRGDCGSTNPCTASGTWDNSRYNYMSYCFPSTQNYRFTSNQQTRVLAAASVTPRSTLISNSDNCDCLSSSQCADSDPCTANTCTSGACTSTSNSSCNCRTPNLSFTAGSTVQDILTISGTTGFISDLNVEVDISHYWSFVFEVALQSPSGTIIKLWDNGCNGSVSSVRLIFDDSGSAIACPPIGLVATIPAQALSAFNGQTLNGAWKLIITDTYGHDESGKLSGWCLMPTLATCATAANCSDSNPCTTDACTNSNCSNTPVANGVNAACDDLNSCTVDACTGGSCNYSVLNGCSCKKPALTFANSSTIQDVVTISGTTGFISDLNVKIDISHYFSFVFDVDLESPTGTIVKLWDNGCVGTLSNVKLIFDDNGTAIACPPIGFVATLPFQSLSAFNGQSFNGIWKLRITDNYTHAQIGTLNEWCLIPTLATCASAANCNDSNPCTTDACTNGNCTNTTLANGINAQCDDANACTTDACLNGICNYSSINGCTCKSPGTIILDQSTVQDVLTVSGITGVISDLNVKVNISHTYPGDLTVFLKSPDATTVQLISGQCGPDDNVQLIFDDEGSLLICPATGFINTIPAQLLSAFDGKSANGNWTLLVSDNADEDNGTLIEWCLIPTISGCSNATQCNDNNPCTTDACNAGTCSNITIPCGNSISGTVLSESSSPIPTITANLTGSQSATVIATGNGMFNFNVNTGGNYTVTPSKNNDATKTNGITTLDITLIRRHLLGSTLLNSPYKIIAADVNSTNSVTTLDIAILRKFILGTDTTFSGNKLWSFVPSDYVFSNPLVPFPYNNYRSYNNLSANQTNQNFIGMKLGDVNNTWNPATPKMGAVGEVQFVISEYQTQAGDEIIVPLKVKDFNSIAGYQFTLTWNAEVIKLLEVVNQSIPGYYGEHAISEGFLTTSWNDDAGGAVSLDDNAVAFELKFKVIGTIGTSSEIKIGSELTASEAYTNALDLLDIAATNGSVKVGDVTSVSNLTSNISQLQVQPNPFTNSTNIIFTIPKEEQVSIVIYDLLGKMVREYNDNCSAGEHKIEWAGDDANGIPLSAGLYHIRLIAGSEMRSVKVAVAR